MKPRVHDLGGQGSPLLITHATGFSGLSYAPLATAGLTDAHHVYALDLSGHAGRPPIHGPSPLRAAAADVRTAVESLPERPHLVGHSLGAVVGLLAEATWDGLFASLYVYEPGLFPAAVHTTVNRHAAEQARRRRRSFGSRSEAMYRYAARPPLSELNAECLAAYVESGFLDEPDGAVRLACDPSVEAAYFDHATDVRIEDVEGLRAPAVVASGSPGRSPLAAHNARLAASLPFGTYRPFEHLGHLGPLEHPPSVAASILELTTRVDRREQVGVPVVQRGRPDERTDDDPGRHGTPTA